MRESRFFGSPAFRRLWISQVLSSLGDWIGLFAITAIAARVAGPSGMSSVLVVRLGMAFFFASFAGVLADRMSRKKLMVLTDIGRFAVFLALPFVDTLWGLILASLILELLTLLWSPAKEASVPNLVKPSFLPTANSMSLAAAYGTIPFATALFAVLAKVPDWAGQSDMFAKLNLTQESVALYFDALTYLGSALVIATLAIPDNRRVSEEHVGKRAKALEGLQEAWEGLVFVVRDYRVRAVVFGLGAGLIGGGTVVPLGAIFATDVLDAGSGGYGLLLTGLGLGVAVGMVSLTLVQKRLHIERTFVFAIFVAAGALCCTATMNGLGAAVMCVAVLGLAAGAVYVLGFTSLQTNVEDEIRGRVFATFITLTRLCLLVAIALAPVTSSLLGKLSDAVFDGSIRMGSHAFALPGVRLTLWLASAIILAAGFFAMHSLRKAAVTTHD